MSGLRVDRSVRNFQAIIVSTLLRDIPAPFLASGWLDQPLLALPATPQISIRDVVASLTLHYFLRKPFRLAGFPALGSLASQVLGRFY